MFYFFRTKPLDELASMMYTDIQASINHLVKEITMNWNEFDKLERELKAQQLELNQKALELQKQYHKKERELDRFDDDQDVYNNEQVAAIIRELENLDGQAKATRQSSLQIWGRIESLAAEMGYDGD